MFQEYNKTAWMTDSIFKDSISDVDNQISIKTPRRQILLITVNATWQVILDID